MNSPIQPGSTKPTSVHRQGIEPDKVILRQQPAPAPDWQTLGLFLRLSATHFRQAFRYLWLFVKCSPFELLTPASAALLHGWQMLTAFPRKAKRNGVVSCQPKDRNAQVSSSVQNDYHGNGGKL